MAIRVEHGKVGTAAQLGLLAGQAKFAQQQMEYAQTAAREAQRMKHEKEMAAFRAQLDIQAEQRANIWELEKMEIRSRTDFSREEAERQRKLSEKQARLDALERARKDGQITEEDYNNAYLQETTDVPFYNYAKQEQMRTTAAAARNPIQEYLATLMSQEGAQTQPAAPTGAPTGRIRVTSPEGQTGTIEAGEWPLYEAQGYRKI